MSSRLRILFLLLTCGLLWTCDTTINIKAPAGNYFIKYFGNEGSQTGADFVVNTDGTLVLFGTTQKAGATTQFYLVKADASGNLIKADTFGIVGSACQARDVALATDGRIVVLGNMTVPGRSDFDIFIKTFNPDLTETGDEYFDGFEDYDEPGVMTSEDAATITQTTDGFIVAGSSGNLTSTNPDIVRQALFLRLDDHLGKYVPVPPVSWATIPAYGQSNNSASVRIVQVPSGDFYVFGYSQFSDVDGSGNDFNFWYFFLNNQGDPTAATNGARFTLPTTLDGKDQKLFSVSYDPTNLKTFFLGGLETDAANANIFVTKLRYPLEFDLADVQIPPKILTDDLGNLHAVLDPPNTSNEFVSVCVSRNSGYLILTNEATTSSNNLLLTKISATGDQDDPAWSVPLVYGGQGNDFVGSVQELPDGKIVIFGTMTVGQASGSNSETKMVLIKVNKDGQFAN